MPQGKDISIGIGGPKKERYARKPENEKHAFHVLIAPKSSHAAESKSTAYKAVLPSIRKNAQMIAAGKLAANGSVLRTGELARLADEQLEMLQKKRAKVRVSSFFLGALTDRRKPMYMVAICSTRFSGRSLYLDYDTLFHFFPEICGRYSYFVTIAEDF